MTNHLLTYTPFTDPIPLTCDTKGALVRIDVHKKPEVTCSKLHFRFPVGDGPECLTTLKAVQDKGLLPVEPTGWSVKPVEGKPGEFVALPNGTMKETTSFKWKNITVHPKHHPVTVSVDEETATGSGKPSVKTAAVRYEKISPKVTFTALEAKPQHVTRGDDTVLSWKGRADASYTVYYGIDGVIPSEQITCKDGTCKTTAKNLRSATTFMVAASATETGQGPVHYNQSIHVTVEKPDVAVGQIQVQSTAGILGSVQAYQYTYEDRFGAVAPTDGLLMLQPHYAGDDRRAPLPTVEVFVDVHRKGSLSHSQRRTAHKTGETPQFPTFMCVPVPAGSKFLINRRGGKPSTGRLYWLPMGSHGIPKPQLATEAADTTEADVGNLPSLLQYYYHPTALDITNSPDGKIDIRVDALDPSITCDTVTVNVPVGTGKEHLTKPDTAESIKPSSTWQSFRKGTQAGEYVAKPTRKKVFYHTPATLTLSGITVNTPEDTAKLEIYETREKKKGVSVYLPVRKVRPGLNMRDFAPDDRAVRNGGTTTVRWKTTYLSGVEYRVQWAGHDEPVQSGEYEKKVGPLYRTTPVYLTAYDTTTKAELNTLTTTVTVTDPDLTARNLTVVESCTLMKVPQVFRPSLEKENFSGKANTDGLLVVSAKCEKAKEPTTVTAKVTPPGGTLEYEAKALAVLPEDGDGLPAGFALPIAKGASVTVARTPTSSTLTTTASWLPFGLGGLNSNQRPESTELVEASSDTAEAPAPEGATTAPPISSFRPDRLSIASQEPVTLRWDAVPNTHLTLTYRDHRGATVNEKVTGKKEHTVQGLTQDTAFALRATEKPDGQGRLLAALTATVTITNPDAVFSTLDLTGGAAMIGPPEKISYGFTGQASKTVTTDGFLTGWIKDTSTGGSKVVATVSRSNKELYRAEVYSAKPPAPWGLNSDAAKCFFDNFFLPVPKGATLAILPATSHSGGSIGDGSREAKLVWIPLGQGR
ncbi:hypothetical protein [Streptomyces palmae]|uniref:hypothetical protein n=1 Tax=Streptomyces palmae TaxID=1701085 RepID=UPI001432F29B|nr:hypothetical protein [Streptomyces palmae]